MEVLVRGSQSFLALQRPWLAHRSSPERGHSDQVGLAVHGKDTPKEASISSLTTTKPGALVGEYVPGIPTQEHHGQYMKRGQGDPRIFESPRERSKDKTDLACTDVNDMSYEILLIQSRNQLRYVGRHSVHFMDFLGRHPVCIFPRGF